MILKADLKQVHGQVAAITSVLFSAAGVFTAVIYYGHYLIDDYGLVRCRVHFPIYLFHRSLCRESF